MIAWNPSLSIGIQEIDEQHQAIVGLINELEANRDSHDPAVAAEAIRFLREYLNGHFDLECELMLDICYPHLESHKQQHELFINHVIFFEIENEFGVVTSVMLSDILAFLNDWFVSHIATEDRKLGAFARTRALAE
uniref:Hemerythrin-like metal-binding domain-containing protein n=1 Tax=Desulfovibrio sp. U5L TaxID=596152 RepID=I2Q0V2_9BACT